MKTVITIYKEHKRIEIILDNSSECYAEWIEGEDSDIGILKSVLNDKVVGVYLPLYHSDVVVEEL